jgi:hypothetical protein
MMRFAAAIAAWAAGTAIAVSVAWLGASVVLGNAGVANGLPASAAPLARAPAPSGAAPAARAAAEPEGARPPRAGPAEHGRSAASGPSRPPGRAPASAPASSPSPSPAASGSVRGYAMAGGRVTLDLTSDSVQLVTAVPGAGFSVQTWSGTGWLRVDFSSGPQVSSLIASWYEHPPEITITN